MKSKHKILLSSPSSPIREFLWIVYKWALIVLCMYFCYGILHSVSDSPFFELGSCMFITFCFILVIRFHSILKRNVEQRGFCDNSIAFFCNLANLMFYSIMYKYGIFASGFAIRKISYKPYLLLLIVLYAIVPVLYYTLFLAD